MEGEALMIHRLGRFSFAVIGLAINVQGQSQASFTFEVASIHVANAVPPHGQMPARGDISGGPGTDNPTRITYRWATMSSILVGAFGHGGDRLLGSPDWADVDRFDLRAIVPAGTSKEQAQEMMQNLLKERFHLAFHHIQKELLSCDLVVAKRGPNLFKGGLKEAASADGVLGPRGRGAPAILDRDGFPILPPGYTDGQAVTRNGVTYQTYRMNSIEAVRAILVFGRTECAARITDKTGLTGKYDFHLEYASPASAGRQIDQAGTPSDPAPDIATAVEQQLGLRLVKSSIKLDVVVIDHLDRKPTEN
jgi:uncharacterized protein (TIGR03435 family)